MPDPAADQRTRGDGDQQDREDREGEDRCGNSEQSA